MKHLIDVFRKVQIPILSLARGQRGITGLETAIILIAFVVVASVFAFTVLSTGIFSAERSKETVHAGLEQAQGSVQLKGSVIAKGVSDVVLSDADAAWEATTNVTATTDANDKKVGENSGSLEVANGKTDLLAYEAIAPTLDLSEYDSIQLWVKSSVATDSGDLNLRISDDAACGTGGSFEDMDLGRLTADSWNHVTVGISAATARAGVACVGLATDDDGLSDAATVRFDEIVAKGQVNEVLLTIANSVGGEPLDLAAPSDADQDGIADSEDRQHMLLVSYQDANQLKNDLYWTKSFSGVDDGDDQLEQGEKAQITVSLEGLDQDSPLTRNTEFSLEVKPATGSTLVIERMTPGVIDPVMNLQ